MLHLTNRAEMAHALTLDLDPRLRDLLTERIAGLLTPYGDLTDWTEFLIVYRNDSEGSVAACLSASLLNNPTDDTWFGTPNFQPHWDWLEDCGSWWIMSLSFGSSAAYLILIEDRDDPLGQMCRQFAGDR